MCHLKGLIFYCLSSTEVLNTSLSSTDSEAPALNKSSTTSLWPFHAAS